MTWRLGIAVVLYFATRKLHDPIGQLQAGRTMRNQDDSAPRENVAAILDEGELTLWVEHGGGFVENEYWRVLQ